MSIRDLWDDIPDAREDSPDVILREQGERLAEKTNGEVRGYVPIRPVDRGGEVLTKDGYLRTARQRLHRRLLLRGSKPQRVPPPVLGSRTPCLYGYPVSLTDHINAKEAICHSREEFEQKLREAFKSKAVRDVIAGLRTASRSMNQAWRRPLPQE